MYCIYFERIILCVFFFRKVSELYQHILINGVGKVCTLEQFSQSINVGLIQLLNVNLSACVPECFTQKAM